MYAECIGADIVQYNEFSMNEKRKKNEKKFVLLYMPFRTFLFSVCRRLDR
jgi:hypothetical protein